MFSLLMFYFISNIVISFYSIYLQKKFMKKQLLLIISYLLCISNILLAQKTEPIFEITAGNVVTNTKFLLQASTGELITGNSLSLMAIDPETKQLLWENKDFLGLEEDDISSIEGTPFIKIERQKTIAISKNKNTFIIQARDGKIVYDSKDAGIKVKNTMIIPELGGILIENIKDGFLSVSFVSFSQAKELWSVPLAKEKSGGIGVGALKRAIKSYSNSAFNIAPQVDLDGNLILVNKKEIFAINKSGVLAWKKEFDDNVDDAYLSTDKKALFIGYKKYIDKLSTVDGNSQIKEAIKMKDELNGISPMGQDYIVYNQKGINIMDAGGNMKWKRDVSIGNISQVKFTDKGILAAEVQDNDTKLTWVNFEGKDLWSEQVSGALVFMEPTAKGVMYVTRQRANILTYEKGKDVWNKDIKIKGVPFFGIDAPNKTVYAYSKDIVHSFNFSDVSYKLIAKDVELKRFKEEEEQATLDIRNNGALLVISSNQAVAAVQTTDGKILYNESFKEIGTTRKNLMKAASFAIGVAGATTTISSMAQGNFTVTQATDANGKEIANTYVVEATDKTGENISGAASQLYAFAKKRFLATQKTKDNLYILSQMPEGNGLLVWSKVNGAISKKITFSDITPQYVVDEASDRLYVVVGNTIKVYDLK
jgi:hypothetical protein